MADERDPTDLAALEEQQEQDKTAKLAQRAREVDDLKWVLSDPRGRRFFWRLLTLTHVFHSSFRLHNGEMSRLEGERNIGLQFWADLHEHAPEAYLRMVKEQKGNGNGNSGDGHRTNR